MWQLGMRKLPEGINFKIGPDWICLHRDFVEYAVTGTDPLLTGLKEMYKYTVSPVEVRCIKPVGLVAGVFALALFCVTLCTKCRL